MSRRIRAASLSLTFVALLITSCGIVSKSPAEVVQVAYMAANAGNYSEAGEHLSKETHAAMEGGLGALAGGMKGIWDEVTRDGTIERIEILEENIRGEGAEVRFRIHYKDGQTEEEDEPLIKEDGKWRITIG